MLSVNLRGGRCVRISLPRFFRVLSNSFFEFFGLQDRQWCSSFKHGVQICGILQGDNLESRSSRAMARFSTRGRGANRRGRGGMRGGKAPQKVLQRRRERFESSRVDTAV